MSDARLLSELKGMKQRFWHERQHLQQDDIQRQWAAEAALCADILLDTEAQTLPLELAPTQGQRMLRQSTSKPWAETAMKRRRSDIVTPTEVGQRYRDALSSEPMSRKRARTSQYGPGAIARNTISTPSLDTEPWQLDSNPPYYGYTNTSTSGPSFKARRTTAGRIAVNNTDANPNIRVYEPAEYLQQSGNFLPSSLGPNPRPQSNLKNHCIPPSPLPLPSPFSSSPTTTASDRFTDYTPATSTAMSRQDSLATSFCDAFGMVRANSGFSEIDSGQNMCRQDSCYGPYSTSFSPNGQGATTPFDTSLYFSHAEGMSIAESPATGFAVEQPQLLTTLELDAEVKRDISTFSVPIVDQVHAPSPLDLHMKMTRDASSDTNISSVSRISRRSQEQVAQAARPIAPKDVPESSMSKQLSSSLSGGQDMLRQRSAPEPKILIPKLQYSRQAKEKLKCDRCNKNPDGYRGSHELHRHMALDHNSSRIAWVCVDVSPDGFLSGCAACESKKPYGQDYNAAAHLRRFHFHPKSEVRRTNVDPKHRRGGKGGGKDPPMSECRRWMKKVEVPGKDFATLTDSFVDDAGNDAGDEDEEYTEEQVEQEEAAEDSVLPANDRTDSETLQIHDAAIGEQVSAFSVDGSNSLDLALAGDRQFALQSDHARFSRSDVYSAFDTSFGTYLDSSAGSSMTPSIDLAASRRTLSSSAPAAPSFLSNNLAVPTPNDFANSTPDLSHISSAMSTTATAHISEEFGNFQASHAPNNISYGMSSPNNPYGLLDFPPFR